MSYTRYEYDVFISYAHADDVRDASGKGWVEQFQEDLRAFLPQRLNGNIPSIFFDRTEIASNHQLAKLRAAARNAAVLLAVTSPNYAARPWTREELQAFTTSNDWRDGEETRLFAIECLEPESRTAYPPPLDSHIAMPFWEKHGAISMPLTAGAGEYRIRINQLASDLAKKLRQIHDLPIAAPPPAPTAGPGRAVLLAQATDDLEEECEQVRTYLAQFNIAVLPAEGYPQGGEAFRSAFAQDLAHASLFVQLLSASPGRRPPDMPEGYTAFQAAAALGAGIPIMQWRSPELKVEAVTNAEHRRLLGGEHVIVDSLEGFKAAVERQVNKPAPAPRSASSSASIFIDASPEDLPVARQIQNQLTAQSTSLPEWCGPSEKVRADLEESMLDCDVLVLVNGQGAPFWVRGQLRFYNKLRGKRTAPPKVLEVILDPPDDKEHGMRLAELERIRVPGTLNKQALQPVLAALAS